MPEKEKRKEYHRNYHKLWYEKNKDKRRKEIKKYGLLHRGDSVKRTQKYVAKNKDKVALYNKEFNTTVEGKYRYLVHRAARWECSPLSLANFSEILMLPCVYCGAEGNIGVDRVNNEIGYSRENSAPCCKTCNYMKKNLTVEDFLSHIKKIYIHNDN